MPAARVAAGGEELVPVHFGIVGHKEGEIASSSPAKDGAA